MDENGTKVLPKKVPPLPQNNCILPKVEVKDSEHLDGGHESEVPDVNEID